MRRRNVWGGRWKHREEERRGEERRGGKGRGGEGKEEGWGRGKESEVSLELSAFGKWSF